jgi:hypothetical protein
MSKEFKEAIQPYKDAIMRAQKMKVICKKQIAIENDIIVRAQDEISKIAIAENRKDA